jgi:hypothetical protein
MTNHAAQIHVDVPLVYIDSTIPAGMTIADYRRSRPQRPRLARRLRCAISGRTQFAHGAVTPCSLR